MNDCKSVSRCILVGLITLILPSLVIANIATGNGGIIDVLGYNDETGSRDYFISIADNYHRVKDCETPDELFNLVDMESRPLNSRSEGALTLTMAAVLSCDRLILPLADQILDQAIYVDGKNYYFSSGVGSEYYHLNASDISCSQDLANILFSFPYRDQSFSKPADYNDSNIISFSCGSDLVAPYTLSLVSAPSKVLVVSYNYIEDGVAQTSFLPIWSVDGSPLSVPMGSNLVAANEYEYQELLANVKEQFGIDTASAVVAFDGSKLFELFANIWFDYCIVRCEEDPNHAIFNFSNLQPVSIASVPTQIQPEFNGDEEYLWPQPEMAFKFIGCESRLLPSIGLITEPSNDWFELLKSKAKGDEKTASVVKFVCPAEDETQVCERKVDDYYYTVSEFKNVLSDGADCEGKSVLKLKLNNAVVVSGDSAVSMTSSNPFDKIIIEPFVESTRQSIIFNYQCSRRSECVNGFDISSLSIGTGKEVVINNLDLAYTLDSSILTDEEADVDMTAINISRATKVRMNNVNISIANDQEVKQWYKGIRMSTGVQLYCQDCQVQADYIGLEVLGAELAVTNTENVTISGGTQAIYLAGRSFALLRAGELMGSTLVNVGSYSRGFLQDVNMKLMTDVKIGPAFSFQTNGIGEAYDLEITGGKITGLPASSAGFVFAKFTSNPIDPYAWLNINYDVSLYRDFIPGLDIDIQESGEIDSYLNCSSLGYLRYSIGEYCF